MYPLKRATAIGRSLSTPAAGNPVTVPPDAVRGTLFGRSIHLPDVNAPDAADIELSSGAVQFLDGAPGGVATVPARRATGGRRPTADVAARGAVPHALRRQRAHAGGRSAALEGVQALARIRRRPVRSPARVSGPGGSTAVAMRRAATRRPWPRRRGAPICGAPVYRPDAAVGRDGPGGARARGAARATPPVAAPAAAAPAPDPAPAPAAHAGCSARGGGPRPRRSGGRAPSPSADATAGARPHPTRGARESAARGRKANPRRPTTRNQPRRASPATRPSARPRSTDPDATMAPVGLRSGFRARNRGQISDFAALVWYP